MEWREKLWLLHESKYRKVKGRPFAEGSRGCHALFVCMLNPLVQNNITLYCPLYVDLYYAVRLFYYLAITSSYNAQFSLTLNDQTHLEANFIAFLHR